MFRIARLIGIVSMAAGAAGCVGNGTVVQPVYIGSYDPGMLNYAAAQGGMPTEVVGNPFDAPKEQVDQAVANNMTGSHFGPELAFTTEVSPDSLSPYRVVMLFDPAPSARSYELCSDPNQPRAPEAGRLRLMAAFCSSDTVITSTAGWISKPQRVTDPAFGRLVRQIAIVLFPLRDPNQNNDREPRLVN